MISIDYNQILDFQFQESKKEYKRAFSWYFLVKSFFSTRKLLKKIKTNLTKQLLNTKGIYAYLLENVADLKGQDLNNSIEKTEKIIKQFSAFQSDLEGHLSEPKFQELAAIYALTTEILDVTYNILRLLKKNNLKTPASDTSEEAKIAIQHSTNTLNKIFHGRTQRNILTSQSSF